MPGEVFVIALISIIAGSALIGAMFWGIYSLIMAKINQGKSRAGDIDPQFFRALSEFKKNTERRIANLESAVSDLDQENYILSEGEQGKSEIEIEEEEVRNADSNEGRKTQGGNLKNMLND